MQAIRLATLAATFLAVGCHSIHHRNRAMTTQEANQAIAGLRAAYAAFSRGDLDAAVQLLNPDVEWTEPAEFPGGGTYHGVDGARRYLAQSRAGAAQVISQPEQFLPAGDRIVVFVHARVLPKAAPSGRTSAWPTSIPFAMAGSPRCAPLPTGRQPSAGPDSSPSRSLR